MGWNHIPAPGEGAEPWGQPLGWAALDISTAPPPASPPPHPHPLLLCSLGSSFEGEARLWPCVWCFVSWSKQYYLKRWHRTWKTEGKHPHPLLWPVPLAALVGMEDTVLRGCSHSCGPAFKLDIKSLSLLIAEHLSEPLFWFFLLKCS